MTSPREVLHQPPNPADLRRVPPASPDCARVRGWARDYVDGDLDRALMQQVDAHVHACRTCAVELGRTEHERLRLLRALGRPALPPLPTDFAARVVARLVRDETATISVDALAAASARPPAPAAVAPPGGGPRRRALPPIAVLFAALALLCSLALLFDALDERAAPQRHARLVVITAEQSFHRHRPLGAGDGLGEHEMLRVGAGGGAYVEWHDASSREQPAATLRLHGKSQVLLAEGAPVVGGRVDLVTNRPVTIPLADGSAIEFGVGDYSLSAEPPPELLAVLGRDDLTLAMPKELLVEIEVRAGDHARILRPGHGPTLVAPGFIGVYQGSGATSIVAAGGGALAGGADAVRREQRDVPPAPITSRLFGRVIDEAGTACGGAEVLLSLEVFGMPFHTSRIAGADGSFQIETQGDLRASWAMVAALPPASRPHLGVLVPDALPLVRQGFSSAFAVPIRLRPSSPLRGLVFDDSGQVREGVAVVPCVVDDAFGLVLPLLGLRTQTDAFGAFQLARLPATLPAQQSLRLVFAHHELSPVVVDVPPRASPLALSELPPVDMRRLRWVRLDAVPGNHSIDLLEEVAGLPAGTALVRRTVFSDDGGAVPLVQIGWGRVWALYGGATTAVVRSLEFESIAGVPMLRPAAGTVAPLATVFQSLQAVPDVPVELANSYRHQRIGRNASPAETAWLRVLNEDGQPAVAAQVFAISGEGARGRGLPRFLGLTDEAGRLSLGTMDRPDVVIIDAAGNMHAERLTSGDEVSTVVVQRLGRVIIAPALRQAAAEIPIEFERRDWPLGGPAPTFVRHVGEASGWEIGDLVPGEYLVRIGESEFCVDVPNGGFVVIGS